MNDISEKEFGELKADIDWIKQELKEIKQMIRKDLDDLKQRVDELEKFRDNVKGATIVISTMLASGIIVWLLSHILG